MVKVLVQNEAECKKCGDRVFSASRHNYRSCKCGAIAVDGGLDYCRRVGNLEDMIDRSICIEEDALRAITEAVEWGKETGRNNKGIALAVLRALRDHNMIKED